MLLQLSYNDKGCPQISLKSGLKTTLCWSKDGGYYLKQGLEGPHLNAAKHAVIHLYMLLQTRAFRPCFVPFERIWTSSLLKDVPKET